jgi:hypothetical protein
MPISAYDIQQNGDNFSTPKGSAVSDLLGVDVNVADGSMYTVMVAAMEFIREEPLEGELRAAIAAAIAAVPGVSESFEDDREAWAAIGSPDARELTAAVANAVAPYATRIETAVASL